MTVAKVMVDVTVGGDEVLGLQLIVVDVLFDGLALFLVVGTAVDDDGLAGVVAHHVGVLADHIADKTLYFHCFSN